MGSDVELTVKVPRDLKERAEERHIRIEGVVREALRAAIAERAIQDAFEEVPFPEGKNITDIVRSDIPPGHFMRIPDLDLENYERIVDEDSWEYLAGTLFHNSPESNYHNAILNFLNYKLESVLDPRAFLLRTSRVALSIDGGKPEPDLMVFDRDQFRRKKRKDGTVSEVVESAPVLIIEIVSKSSTERDSYKETLYWEKGVRESWRIFIHEEPVSVTVCELREGVYQAAEYIQGEVRSRVLPQFAINFNELADPDSIS